MTKNKIRVNTGIEIEVNDKGETITVNIDDARFLDNFFALTEKVRKAAEEYDTEVNTLDDDEKKIAAMKKIIGEITSSIDEAFGKDCCRKVFGNIIPSIYLIVDFFDQITPIIEEYADNRRKSISRKYSGNRKGVHSKKQE